MHIRRVAMYSVAALVLGGVLTAPSALAASRHPARPSPAAKTVGHIAFLTKQQTVKIATVAANGTTSGVKRIGPVSLITPKQTLQVFDLMASGDGEWVAWQEQILTKHPFNEKTVLVLRQSSSGTMWHLTTGQAPVGFAKDQLVTSDGSETRRLDLQPTAHLVKVNDHQFPLAAYSHGVIDTDSLRAPSGPSTTEALRLTTFGGSHTTLHEYVLAPTDYRYPDAAWVSGDGKHVVVERGNHQDFGGLGPSSLADEFRLGGGHARSPLGHYGTAKDAWRIASVGYAGSTDAVWAVWERATKTGATSIVADHVHGTWAPVTTHGIAVAGSHKGYVISQPGKFVSDSVNEEVFDIVPTSHAKLIHGSTTVSLDAEGSAFVWIAG